MKGFKFIFLGVVLNILAYVLNGFKMPILVMPYTNPKLLDFQFAIGN